MNGSELVIKRVKKKQFPAMVMFLVITAIFLLIGIIGFLIENYVMVAVMIIFTLPFLIPAIIFTIRYVRPMKCAPLKHHPEVLKQADWMVKHMNYQDEIILASPEFFAPRSDLTSVIPVQEVLLMYKGMVYNHLNTVYTWQIETVRRKVVIPYTQKQEPAIANSINYLAGICPHMKVGFSDENIQYVEYMRTMWEEAQKTIAAGQNR